MYWNGQRFSERGCQSFYHYKGHKKSGSWNSAFESVCKRASGDLEITSEKLVGTTVKASFKISHIDRLPLGNLAQTMESLIVARPDIEYDLTLDNKKERFIFNSFEIKRRIGEVPLTHFEVLKWIGEYVNDGVKTIFGGILDEILG